MASPKIPRSDSIEELARFWDSHDLADFEGDLEEVSELVFERETVVKVRLPSKEAATPKKMAQSKGPRDADLISEWILERVHAS